MVRVPKARTAIAVVILAGVAGTAGPVALPAGTPTPLVASAGAATPKGHITRAVRALQAAQRSDGGFGTGPGAASSDPATSVWAALALASADVRPEDQPAKGTTVDRYLQRHAKDLRATEDLAAMLLLLDATGGRGTPVGRATALRLTERQGADGGFPGAGGGASGVTPTALALLALARANLPTEVVAQTRGQEWLRRAAAKSGGWGETPGAPPKPGATALALQALRTAKFRDGEDYALETDGQSFLTNAVRGDGGLGDDPGTSDPLVTARAVQAIVATKADPDTLRRLDSPTAEAYLATAQAGDGGFGSTLRTAQVLPGLDATTFPLAVVQRASGKPSDSDDDGPKNGAVPDGDPGKDAAPGQRATADEPRGGASPSAGTSPPAAPSATPSNGSPGGGATPSPTPAATPAPAATTPPAADTPAPEPPAPTTTESTPAAAGAAKDADEPKAPAKDETAADPVSGLVVGAQAAAATTPGGVSGAGAATDHGPALGLGVGLLLVAAVGTQLERRRAKGPFA